MIKANPKKPSRSLGAASSLNSPSIQNFSGTHLLQDQQRACQMSHAAHQTLGSLSVLPRVHPRSCLNADGSSAQSSWPPARWLLQAVKIGFLHQQNRWLRSATPLHQYAFSEGDRCKNSLLLFCSVHARPTSHSLNEKEMRMRNVYVTVCVWRKLGVQKHGWWILNHQKLMSVWTSKFDPVLKCERFERPLQPLSQEFQIFTAHLPAFTSRGFIRRSESAANHCATLANRNVANRTSSRTVKRNHEDGRKLLMKFGIKRNALPRMQDNKPKPPEFNLCAQGQL